NAHEDEELFIKSKPLILDTVVTLMDSHKVPLEVVEIIQIILASDSLSEEHVLAIVNRLVTPTWNTQARMKLLQISFYFTRYDIYSGKEVFSLLSFILDCFEIGDSSLDSAARPILAFLVEKVLKRAVVTESSYCDLAVDAIKNLSVEDSKDASLDKMGQVKDNLVSEEKIYSRSRSQECVKIFSVSYTEDILKFLDAVYSCIHRNRIFTLGSVLLSVVKYSGILTIIGMEEFIKKKLFIACSDILKQGRTEDKDSIYAAVVKIQKKYGRMFEESLGEFYMKLPKFYDDKNSSFYFFILELLKTCTRKASEREIDSSRPPEIPSPLYEIFERTINELQLYKKGDKNKMDFIEEALKIFKNSGDIYSRSVDVILTKIHSTKETVLDIREFVGDTLRIVAHNGDRELFERVLSVCPEDLLLAMSFELRYYMKDSWLIVVGRTTSSQRRNMFVTSLSQFSVEELGYLIRHLEQEELETVFNSSTETLSKSENLEVFEDLIKRIDNIKVVSQLLIRFYGSLQETQYGSVEAGEHITTNFDPEELAIAPASQPVKDLSVPTTPLNTLRRFIEGNPQHYPEVLSCLTSIIRIVCPTELWGVVFSIIDMQREQAADQVSILLVIAENYISTLHEKYIIKILNILKRMTQSQDCSTCLNALFIYQELGEFLITKSILGQDLEETQETYKISSDVEETQPVVGRREGKNIKMWRDFVILGAFIMKDARNFVVMAVIKYLMCFIKAEQVFFNEDDFKFLEKIVFSQMLKLNDIEVKRYSIQELSEYAGSYSMHGFIREYVDHLVELLLEDDEMLGRIAVDSLKVVFKKMYNDENYVVCEGNNIEALSMNESNEKLLEEPEAQGIELGDKQTDFIIKRKVASFVSNEAFRTFVNILRKGESIRSAYFIDILRIFSIFSYKCDEIDKIISLLENRIRQDGGLIEDIVDAVDSICCASGFETLSLVYFSKWLNEKNIESLKVSITEKPVSSLLLLRMGETMRRSSRDPRSGEVLRQLLDYATEETVESVLNCVSRGYSNIGRNEDFEDVISFSCGIFRKVQQFTLSRRKERKYIEYLTFYHLFIRSYFMEKSIIGVSEKDETVLRVYEPVVHITNSSYKDLRLKGYQVLFTDFSRCHVLLQNRLKSLFQDYSVDFSRSGDALHNFRLTEVLYCLRCLVVLADPVTIDFLKNEITELILAGDASMLWSVQKCLKILFVEGKSLVK
ncbi:hypothetical protein PAEPH01_2165, partial [Pancytospora epiphaga]